jgi:putative ABC transport system substrate-binding protein
MLITAFLIYVFATPVAVQAEQARAVPEVGFLLPVVRADYDEAKDPLKTAFLEGLRALGYVEGKNIHVEFRVPRKPDDVAEMAADLVNRKVDVIATTGPQPIEAARRATNTIPIVIVACDRADRLVNSIPARGKHHGNGLHLVRPCAQATATYATDLTGAVALGGAL